jgi:UDP-N-acetylmuramyl pentapeptide synthase
VLNVTAGHDAKAIATIAAELAEHGCPPEQIEAVSIDISPSSSRLMPVQCRIWPDST